MASIITDLLDETAQRLPDKPAYVDQNRTVTFARTRAEARLAAQGLIKEGLNKKPVIVFIEKSVECIISIFGIAYSGNYYTVMDTSMPPERMQKIIDTLQPAAFLTVEQLREQALAIAGGRPVLVYEELMKQEPDDDCVSAAAARILSTDVLYVLFTSGSTGVPKGVVTSHQALYSYVTTCYCQVYGLTGTDVLLNQVPLYFVMAVIDIFGPVLTGATTHMVPSVFFSFPAMLVKYIEEHKVTLIDWVPSILQSIVTMDAFEVGDVSSIRTIIFGGEEMPVNVIRAWSEHIPGLLFINGYGSTECTDGCMSYVFSGVYDSGDRLPIGKPNPNMEILLLDENDQLVTKPGEAGEICARGPSLSYGYYNDPDRTAEVFVQNPLNSSYEDKIYRTGDLGTFDENGDYHYIGRKDFQIKYLGYRIELGEIEAVISTVPGVEENACLYDAQSKNIVLFYTGTIDSKELSGILTKKLPIYMLPRRRVHLEQMPHNLHGKINRAVLRENLVQKQTSGSVQP